MSNDVAVLKWLLTVADIFSLKQKNNMKTKSKKTAKKTKISDKKLNISVVIKRCHSFWHRECENRDRECYRCEHYY